MKPLAIKKNPKFIGRESEMAKLHEIGNKGEAAIVVVYGKRRVGKTELLEQAFRERNIIKIEGLEGLSFENQRHHVLRQIAAYLDNPVVSKVQVRDWVEILELLAPSLKEGKWTLYFEEVQWLANYEDGFVSALKYMWDNHFRHNKDLVVVLCGSAPSFLIQKVLHSRALYNRSQHEMPLGEFNLMELKAFLAKKANREVMDACLSVGGVPEYLKKISQGRSVFLSLCENSFVPGGFFAHEFTRLFTSSFAANPHYQRIVEFLGGRAHATRSEIAKHLKLGSGGTLSALLQDLELCGFVRRYTPYYLKENSLLARYEIADAYLQFYYKFIKPLKTEIENGVYKNRPVDAIKSDTYYKWLGYAFERFCRRHHHVLACALGFSAVRYRSGAFFSRKTAGGAGYQMDLVFDRDDHVLSVCEIKYTQAPVDTAVIHEFEKKLSYFDNASGKTLDKVLISASGASEALKNSGYFDRILTLEDLFEPAWWRG